MKWILLVAIIGVIVFAFGRTNNIKPEMAFMLVEEGGQLIDVRTPGEFATGHIKGAVNIPLNTLSDRLGELDKSTGVVLYCRSGQRSGNAARVLEAAGFQNVHNLGAMSRWPAK